MACCVPSGDVFATPVTGVTGGDDAGALEVARQVGVAVGLVVGVHHVRGMRLQAVGAEARAAALYGLAVYEAAGVVDVVLQVRPVGAVLGDAPLPASGRRGLGARIGRWAWRRVWSYRLQGKTT